MSVKRKSIFVPKDNNQANGFIGSIGYHQGEIEEIEKELNVEVMKLKKQAGKDIKAHKEKINELMNGLCAFAEVKKDELLSGRSKTINFPYGSISWRITPPKVVFRNESKILHALKDLGLSKFIRTKEEVNKQAILESPEEVKDIKGLSISQIEEFVVKPRFLDREVIKSFKK
ncbi:MAG: host-nuclease inhibitor Gam family protein [Patescibacteria group bacterium]